MSVLKQMYRGRIVMSASSRTVNVDIGAAVTLANSWLEFNLTAGNSNDPEKAEIEAYFVSTTQIRFESDTNQTADIIINWTISEYTSGVVVQSGAIDETSWNTSGTPHYKDVTVTATSLTKSFVTLSFQTAETSSNRSTFFSAELTSTTNLRIYTGDVTAVALSVRWQIVEGDDFTVQKVKKSLTGTGTTTTETITSVDTTRTALMGSNMWISSSSGDNNDVMWGAYLSNATTIGYERITGTDLDFEHITYVTEFPTGITVQRGNINYTAGSVAESASLPTRVTPADCLLNFPGQHRGGNDSTANTIISHRLWEGQISANNIDFVREAGGSTTGNVRWEIIEHNTDAPVLKQKLTEPTTLTATNATKILTLSQTVDTTKSFILITNNTSGLRHHDGQLEFRFTSLSGDDSSEITIYRGNTLGDCDIVVHVWEYESGVTVQHFRDTTSRSAAAEYDITINSVRPKRTFLITSQPSEVKNDLGGQQIAYIDAATNVSVHVGGNTAQYLSVQVVEMNRAFVQSVRNDSVTSTTFTHTLLTVDTSKVLWLGSATTDNITDGAYADLNIPDTLSSTAAVWTSRSTPTGNMIRSDIIETEDFDVDNGSVNFIAGDGLTKDFTVSTIAAITMPFCSWQDRPGGDEQFAGVTKPQEAFWKVTNPDSTTLRLTKATATGNSKGFYQQINYVGSAGGIQYDHTIQRGLRRGIQRRIN